MSVEDYLIIMPAYNEEKVIGKTLDDLLQVVPRKNVIVVDDGSRDNTGSIVLKKGVVLVQRRKNGGYSCALRTGIHYYLSHRSELKGVIFYDSDGQHVPEFVKRLVCFSDSSNYDIIIGSRFRGNHDAMPFSRVVGNRGISIITSILARKYISDSQSGIRLIKKRVLDLVTLKSSDYAISSELIIKSARRFSIVEVPIEALYDEYTIKKGTNPFNAFKIVYEILKVTFGFNGLRDCVPSDYDVIHPINSI